MDLTKKVTIPKVHRTVNNLSLTLFQLKKKKKQQPEGEGLRVPASYTKEANKLKQRQNIFTLLS